MKMRITAMNDENIFIQIFNNKKWEQHTLTREQFTNFMKKHFSNDYMKYQNTKNDIDIFNYFYHYNETKKMIQKGEAFVFES